MTDGPDFDTPDLPGDVSATDAAEMIEVLAERRRLASIVEATTDLIGSFRLDGTCRWLNPSARRALAVEAQDFDLFAALGDSVGRFRSEVLPALVEHGAWVGELLVTDRARDHVIHLAANVIADRDLDGGINGWTLVGHDLTEYKVLHATLAHKATHDSLTGLANRALLAERLAAHMATGAETTVLFVDLDGFKQLNDTFGHEFGDDALIQVASRIAAAVESGGFAARYGGDEFVVLPDPAWADPVAELEERVFVKPFTVGPIIIDISGRIGTASSEPGESGQSLISRADREMYRAKHTRRRDD